MTDTPPTRYRFKFAGVLVGLVAFALTRFVVAEAMSPTASVTGFLLGQGPFLIAGLGVSLVGVGLAVSTVEERYANTVALWALIGAGVMGFVLASSVLEASYRVGTMSAVDVRLGSKVLIGGLVGGTLTGFTIARNRRHQAALDHQNDRLVVLNRLLRHHVLNKANIIGGYSKRDGDIPAGDVPVLRRSARHITETIEDVRGLTDAYSRGDPSLAPQDLGDTLRDVIDQVDRETSGSPTTADLPTAELRVVAGQETDTALHHLLTHISRAAAEVGADVSISTTARNGTVALRIESEEALLTDTEQGLLAEGGLPDYDDPAVGFELPMARLLFEQMDVALSVDVAPGTTPGTWLTIWFPRENGNERPSNREFGLSPRNVTVAGIAGVLAGIAMGSFVQITLEQIAVIGSLYGSGAPVVGWITHLFHSAVFGVVFGALCSHPTLSQRLGSWRRYVLAGLGYALGLWLVAASVVMPAWLTLVGVPTPVPTFQPQSLLAHLVWGLVVSASYGWFTTKTGGGAFRERLQTVPRWWHATDE